MEFAPEEMKKVSNIARKFASRWGQRDGRYNYDDINSHLTLWLCENYKVLERYRKEEGGMGKLEVALSREAAKYCANESIQNNRGSMYYDIQYTPAQIERILPFIWDYAVQGLQTIVPEHPQHGTPIITGNSAKFDDALAIVADVSSVYYSLMASDKKALQLRYKYDLTFSKVAEQLGITEEAARKRVDRAVLRIAEKLTGGGDLDSKPNGRGLSDDEGEDY